MRGKMMAKLFEATTINTKTVVNRLVHSTTYSGIVTKDSVVTTKEIVFMVRLTEGDVGLAS
jgi:2,4-dienoyl-CoA reductase-like NADH-dependent reductase (Old Yellow Enzyme family)